MPNLYIVATPIGNLEDITLRALRILREVDFVLAEDTRVTKKLLDRYEIDTPLISYHHHSDERKMREIGAMLGKGKNLALVTDAGTPGISDPGNKLIEYLAGAIHESSLRDIQIVPIPGPSALTAMLSVSGFPTDNFVFLGFPPHKKGRQKYFKEVLEQDKTVAFYESCYRIVKALEYLQEIGLDREVMVGKELTKQFESFYRGNISEVLEQVKNSTVKGEYVVVIHANKYK